MTHPFGVCRVRSLRFFCREFGELLNVLYPLSDFFFYKAPSELLAADDSPKMAVAVCCNRHITLTKYAGCFRELRWILNYKDGFRSVRVIIVFS